MDQFHVIFFLSLPLISFSSRVLLAGTFLNFLAYCVISNNFKYNNKKFLVKNIFFSAAEAAASQNRIRSAGSGNSVDEFLEANRAMPVILLANKCDLSAVKVPRNKYSTYVQENGLLAWWAIDKRNTLLTLHLLNKIFMLDEIVLWNTSTFTIFFGISIQILVIFPNYSKNLLIYEKWGAAYFSTTCTISSN